LRIGLLRICVRRIAIAWNALALLRVGLGLRVRLGLRVALTLLRIGLRLWIGLRWISSISALNIARLIHGVFTRLRLRHWARRCARTGQRAARVWEGLTTRRLLLRASRLRDDDRCWFNARWRAAPTWLGVI
jgi:hypothetical protein